MKLNGFAKTQHFSTFSHLFKWICKNSTNEYLSSIDIVSFDVFDTLLFRRCSAESVQRGVAVRLADELGGTPDTVDAVYLQRERAFRICAEKNVKNGLDFDAHIKDINLVWAQNIAPQKPDCWPKLTAIALKEKIQFELWACYPNPVIKPLLEYLVKHRKQLIFVSDMYLGEVIISDLLSANGLRDYFAAGYVSGDNALSKNSGRLFKHVLNEQKIEAHRVLHIGDDAHTDGLRAMEQGLKSIVVREREVPIRRMRFDYNYSLRDSKWIGLNAAKFSSAERQVQPEFRTIGRDILGPPLAVFIHALAEFCMRVKPDAVYFLSREGFLLRDLYDQLIQTLQFPLPCGRYLCASRLTASTAAMRGFGWREIVPKIKANHTVRNIMKPLQFTEIELKNLAETCALTEIDLPLKTIDSPAFARLLNHIQVQDRARRIGQDARAELRNYLNQQKFFDANRVVLVDVGWACQIQEGLESALSNTICPSIYGYYLGTNEFADERRRAGLNIRSDLADLSRFEWSGCSVFQFVEMFEIPSRAFHGTVIGYKNGEPILLPEESEERYPELIDEGKIALMQDGIHEYMLHYSRYTMMTGMSASDSLTYARNIVARVVFLPRRSELQKLSSLTHMANFGSCEHVNLVKKASLFSIKSFLTAVNTSQWRQGTAALKLGKLGALLLAILQAPKIHRKLPLQYNDDIKHEDDVPTDDRQPLEPLSHNFESDVQIRFRNLVKKEKVDSPAQVSRQPFKLHELGWLHFGYRTSNIYLMLKKMDTFKADLLPFHPWLWREIYIRIPRHGRIGQSLRFIKRRLTTIIHPD